MEESTIFLTLTPSDLLDLAKDAFRLPHNRSRYVKPSPLMDDGPSRRTTPSIDNEDFADDLEYFHRIQLRSDQGTKVKGRITFGSDPDRCDVLLASKRGQYGISGLHFYITFDNQERPVIKDVSKIGLTISYDEQAKDERRNHFQWILFDGFETITVELRKNGLAFDVHLPKHDNVAHKAEYRSKIQNFINSASQDHLETFNDLMLRSENTSLAPSEILSPTKRPIYLEYTELGKGGFGRVYKAVNASTGFEYAGKEFFHQERWTKEIEIMRRLCHEHIVEFIDFRRVPKPLLVMEYISLGNLETQHQICSIADEDMELIFNQCLKSLCYLHSHNITHRDLKPENILMFSRRPPNIKLADFGLAQDKLELKTFCGSPKYAAPEIFQDQYYTNAVDIWSLAVIVLKFVYGLPEYKPPTYINRKQELQSLGLSWCKRLITIANDWDSDRLVDFITEYMLRWEPQERLSAAECLSIAPEFGVFTGALFQTGSATPRLQPMQVVNNINTEDVSTILGPLWQNVATFPRTETPTSRSQKRSVLIPEEQVDTFCARIASSKNVSSKNEISSALSPAAVHIGCEQTEQVHPRIESEDDQTPSPVSGEPYDNRSFKRRRIVSHSDHPEAPDQPAYEPLRKAELPQPQIDTPQIHHTANFYIVDCGIGDVAIRKKDFKVNITQVIKMAGKQDDKVMDLHVKDIKRQRKDIHFEVVGGIRTIGSYTNFSEAIEICELYDLPLIITQSLLKVQSIYQQHHKHPAESEG